MCRCLQKSNQLDINKGHIVTPTVTSSNPTPAQIRTLYAATHTQTAPIVAGVCQIRKRDPAAVLPENIPPSTHRRDALASRDCTHVRVERRSRVRATFGVGMTATFWGYAVPTDRAPNCLHW